MRIPATKRVFAGLTALLCGLGLAAIIFLLFRHSVNMTESVMKIDGVAGQHIDITYTNSDSFAKDEWISVYATKRDTNMNWFAKTLTRKHLLLRYDPFSPETPLPSFTQVTAHRLSISVPRVSSVTCQREEMGNLTIEYHIAEVQYQTPIPKCQ